jgi:hypothetical protein
MDGLLGKGDMSKGQQILNSEEVEFLLDSGSSGAKQGQDAAQGAQQAVTMRGDLDQMPLGDVFQTLGLTKMEGVLRVCNPVEQRIVYFRNGLLRIVVPPRLLMRRLGQRLLQAGVLTADDLRAALTEQKRTPRSLDEVLVYFPDPWHKKRHHKRRLIQPPFVALLLERLRIGGVFRLATDWEPYAHHMLEVLSAEPRLRNRSADGTFIPRPEERPVTKFERRGHRLGHGTWDLAFERIA